MTRFSPSTPLKERVMASIAVTASGCWEWQLAKSKDGYGKYTYRRKFISAHRLAYEVFVGQIPDRHDLDHLCKNRCCCNPGHLEPVTKKENWLRGDSPSLKHYKQTHCVHGHELAGDNLHVSSAGKRSCRACNRRRALDCKRRRIERMAA